MKRLRWTLLAVPLAAGAAGPAREYRDQATGLDAWEWQAEGIKLQQIQRLPDQTRAFFLGRGFGREEAERIAATCVFQTLFYNLSEHSVSVRLSEWRVATADGLEPLKLTAGWQREWETLGSPQSARIAFQWALFPNDQQFEHGDWNMGMITYPIRPGTSFDLHFVWWAENARQEGILPGLRCAEDKAIPADGNAR